MKLQDEGVIQKYYNKWWKEAANLKCHQEDKRKDIASELGFANIGGVFVILGCGLILSMFVAALEFSIKIRNRKGREVERETPSSNIYLPFFFRFLFAKKCDDIFVLLFLMLALRDDEQVYLSKMFHYSIHMIMITNKSNIDEREISINKRT